MKRLCELLGMEYVPLESDSDFSIPKDAVSDNSGFRNPNYGKKHSLRTRKLMSLARKGVNTNTKEGCDNKRSKWLINNPNYDPVIKERMTSIKSKTYIVTDPIGKVFTVKNMTKFCKENGLSKGNMCAVAQGRYTASKGWHCSYI